MFTGKFAYHYCRKRKEKGKSTSVSTEFSRFTQIVEVFLQIKYWLKNKLVHLVADLFLNKSRYFFYRQLPFKDFSFLTYWSF